MLCHRPVYQSCLVTQEVGRWKLTQCLATKYAVLCGQDRQIYGSVQTQNATAVVPCSKRIRYQAPRALQCMCLLHSDSSQGSWCSHLCPWLLVARQSDPWAPNQALQPASRCLRSDADFSTFHTSKGARHALTWKCICQCAALLPVLLVRRVFAGQMHLRGANDPHLGVVGEIY